MIALLFAVFGALLWLTYDFLQSRPELASPFILRYLLVLVFASISVVVVRIISYLLIDMLFTRWSRKQPSELLRLVIAVFLYGISTSLILRFVLHADIAAIITTSALITAIAGFALQATLGNLFEGLSVQIHQPFHIGDRVRVGEFYGVVESLTWRAVLVRQEDGTEITIPNNMLAQGALQVFRSDRPVRVTVDFPAPIDVPPRRIIVVVLDAISTSPEISPSQMPEVLVKEIAAENTAILYEARFYTMPERELHRVQAHIRERIWYALARAGIAMPTPIEGSINAFKVSLLRSNAESLLTPEDDLRIMASSKLFTGLSDAHLRKLEQIAVRLIFAPGEIIPIEGQSRYSLFIVMRGLVNVPLYDIDEVESERSDTGIYWQPEILEKIRIQYAEFMGPMSGYLVRESARRTSDAFHLYRMLAEDIPLAEDRARFIANGPSTPAREIERGDFFNETALLLGETSEKLTPMAVSEVEMLEIGVSGMRRILQDHPEMYPLLANNLATYMTSDIDGKEALPDWVLTRMERFHRVRV